MIDSFSPITRKLIAVAILFLAVMFCVNILVLPAMGFMREQLDGLADARFQRARLESIQERPLPAPGDPIPANLYIRANASEAAQSRFVATLNALANSNAVSLEQANVVPLDSTAPQRVAIDLSVSGPDVAITSFINAVEAHRPMIRFASWKITAGQPGQGPVRLSGRAVAVWSRTR